MSDTQYIQFAIKVVENPLEPELAEEQIITLPCATVYDLCNQLKLSELDISVYYKGELVEKESWKTTYMVEGHELKIVPNIHDNAIARAIGFIIVAIVSIYTFGVLGGFAGNAFWAGMAAAAVSAVGNFLVNALFPIELPKAGSLSTSRNYDWNPVNTQREGLPLPVIYGKNKVKGNFIEAHTSYAGYFDVLLEAVISLGQGPIHSITDVTVNGQPNPGELYESCLIDTALGHMYQRPPLYGSYGSIETEYTPDIEFRTDDADPRVYNTVGDDYDALRVVFYWPQGMYHIENDGDRRARSVLLRVEIKNNTTGGDWHDVLLTNVEATTTTATWSYGYWGEDRATHGDATTLNTWYSIRETLTTDLDLHYEGEPEQESFPDYEPAAFWRLITSYDRVSYTSVPGKLYTLYSTRPLYRTEFFNTPTAGNYSIRVTKTTYFSDLPGSWPKDYGGGDFSSTTDQNTVKLFKVNEIERGDSSYPREALIGITVKANQQISGNFDLSAIVYGKIVRVYNGSSWVYEYSNNPAWVCYDILTQPVLVNSSTPWFVGGRHNGYSTRVIDVDRYDGFNPSFLDTASFYEWAQFCDTLTADGHKRAEFNGVFDFDSTVWDAVLKVCQVGRASVIYNGKSFEVVIEQPTSPVALITMGNIVKGSFNEYFNSMEDRATELEFDYIDEDNNYEKTSYSVYDLESTDLTRKTRLELFGITNFDQAVRAAQLRLNFNKYLIRNVEFDMAIDAIGFTVGDVINFQHDTPQWGYGGRTEQSYNALTIQLDQEVTLGDGPYEIMIRFDNDTLETRTVSSAQHNNTVSAVNVTSAFSTTPTKYSPWAIALQSTSLKPFRIQKISKSGDLEVHVNAIEYNADVYLVDNDNLTLPTPDYTLPVTFPLVTDLAVSESFEYTSAGTPIISLDVSFTKPKQLNYSKFIAFYMYESASVWRSFGEVDENFTIEGVASGSTYYIAIVTVNDKLIQNTVQNSPKVSITTSAAIDPNPLNPYLGTSVTGLGLFGGGSTFNTKDCHIIWNDFVDEWTRDGWFKHFRIQVYDGASQSLRTDYSKSAEYIYTRDKNYYDGSNRDLKFRVYVVDVNDNESTSYAEITGINNPQIDSTAEISSVTATIGILRDVRIDWDAAEASDLAGYEIHIGTTSGFTPVAGTLIGKVGANTTTFVINSLVPDEYWVKVGAYDTFGTTGINYVSSTSFTTLGLEVAETDLTQTLADRIDQIESDASAGVDITEIENYIATIKADLEQYDVVEYNAATTYNTGDYFWYGTSVYKVLSDGVQNVPPPNVTYYEVVGTYSGFDDILGSSLSYTTLSNTVDSHDNSITAQASDITNLEVRLDSGVNGLLSDPDFDLSNTWGLYWSKTGNISFDETGDEDGGRSVTMVTGAAPLSLVSEELFPTTPGNTIPVMVRYKVTGGWGLAVPAMQLTLVNDSEVVQGTAIGNIDTSVEDQWLWAEFNFLIQAGDITQYYARVYIPYTATVATLHIAEVLVGDFVLIKKNSSAISILETTVSDNEDGIFANSQAITALEGTVNDPTTGVSANASAITILETNVSSNDDEILANSQAITSLSNSITDPTIGLQASADAIDTLQTNVSSNDDDISAISTNITRLKSYITSDNFVTDPYFDLSDIAGLGVYWSDSTQISIDSTGAEDGTACLRLDANGTIVASTIKDGEELAYIPIKNGDRFSVTYRYYSTLTFTGTPVGYVVAFYDKNKQALSSWDIPTIVPINSSWETETTDHLVATAPANTAFMTIGLNIRSTATSGYVLFDTFRAGKLATHAAFQEQKTSTANSIDALAEDITTLSSTVGGHTTTIQTQSNSIDGLEAQFTVKIDNNGFMSGFGLASETSDSGVVSEFAVLADKFTILNSNASAITISSMSGNGTTATANTSTVHGLSTNDIVNIVGADPYGFNGTQIVTVIDSDTFTFPCTVSSSASVAEGYVAIKMIECVVPFYISGGEVFIEAKLNAENIEAGVITGTTLQTALSGERIVLYDPDSSWVGHTLTFYDSSGSNALSIGTRQELGDGVSIGGELQAEHFRLIGSSPIITTQTALTFKLRTGIAETPNQDAAIQGNSSRTYIGLSNGYNSTDYNYSVGVEATGYWPLRIEPSGSAGTPTHHALKGVLYVDSAGVLYINTDGSGTWEEVGGSDKYTASLSGSIINDVPSFSYSNLGTTEDFIIKYIATISGTIAFSVALKTSLATGTAYCKIYVNGSYNSQVTTTSTSYTTLTISSISVSKGDRIEIALDNSNSGASTTVYQIKFLSSTSPYMLARNDSIF